MFINPITHGISDQRLLMGGGSLGPRSYFQLILTFFWTHGTIIDQFIVKGVHQRSCKKKKNSGYPKNCPSYTNFPQ